MAPSRRRMGKKTGKRMRKGTKKFSKRFSRNMKGGVKNDLALSLQKRKKCWTDSCRLREDEDIFNYLNSNPKEYINYKVLNSALTSSKYQLLKDLLENKLKDQLEPIIATPINIINSNKIDQIEDNIKMCEGFDKTIYISQITTNGLDKNIDYCLKKDNTPPQFLGKYIQKNTDNTYNFEKTENNFDGRVYYKQTDDDKARENDENKNNEENTMKDKNKKETIAQNFINENFLTDEYKTYKIQNPNTTMVKYLEKTYPTMGYAAMQQESPSVWDTFLNENLNPTYQENKVGGKFQSKRRKRRKHSKRRK
jgi:hypothetical protein